MVTVDQLKDKTNGKKFAVTFDRYCGSIVKSHGIENKNKSAGRKPKSKCQCSSCEFASYTKKSPRTIKKLTQIINLFYELRKKDNHRFYWVTITTVQHKTLRTDQELFYAFKLWKQHDDSRYVCVAERQKDTGDLHFHLIIERTSDFDFKKELQRLGSLLGTASHPALFDAKRIRNVQTLVGYIGKYVRKPVPSITALERAYARKDQVNPKTGRKYGYKAPYSSLYHCRTFSYSGSLGNLFKERHDSFRVSVDSTILEDYPHLFEKKYQTEFMTVYKYDISLWNLCQHYKSELLKKPPKENLQDLKTCHILHTELPPHIAT